MKAIIVAGMMFAVLVAGDYIGKDQQQRADRPVMAAAAASVKAAQATIGQQNGLIFALQNQVAALRQEGAARSAQVAALSGAADRARAEEQANASRWAQSVEITDANLAACRQQQQTIAAARAAQQTQGQQVALEMLARLLLR